MDLMIVRIHANGTGPTQHSPGGARLSSSSS
jgi:hypothetical protein